MPHERGSVPVTALKASLSRYLRRVKAGEEVIVTERDRAVAKIVPIAGAALPAQLRALAREGRIPLGHGALDDAFWRLPRPKDAGSLLRRALEEERDRAR